MKRITKPNYHLATPAELKSILSAHSLPITGDKPALEARVQEWILLYNSNLDTSHPKSLSALRAKLNEIEASRKRDKEKGKDALGEQLTTKEGVAKYVKERGGEFERLRKEVLARDSQALARAKGQAGKPIEIE
jgi:E3 ubiquitin-protein ligase RAD18